MWKVALLAVVVASCDQGDASAPKRIAQCTLLLERDAMALLDQRVRKSASDGMCEWKSGEYSSLRLSIGGHGMLSVPPIIIVTKSEITYNGQAQPQVRDEYAPTEEAL